MLLVRCTVLCVSMANPTGRNANSDHVCQGQGLRDNDGEKADRRRGRDLGGADMSTVLLRLAEQGRRGGAQCGLVSLQRRLRPRHGSSGVFDVAHLAAAAVTHAVYVAFAASLHSLQMVPDHAPELL